MSTRAAPVAESIEPWGAAEKKRLTAELERLDADALEAAQIVAQAGTLARQHQATVLQKRSNVLAALADLKSQCPEVFQ